MFRMDIAALIKCVNFAAIKHKDQRRKDETTPYINHPIGVANILVEEGNITDPVILMAAILHDTVEDTDTSFSEIQKHFGDEVEKIVVELTDDKNLPKHIRKELQIARANSASYRAKLVKLADKLYNIRDLENSLPVGWSETRRTEYFQWAKAVVDNLRGTNEALENALDAVFQRTLKAM